MTAVELIIARDSLLAAVKGNEYTPDLSEIPNELGVLGMSFVTVTKGGELRGCMGTLTASEPLGADIAINARKAALSDPRFRPIKEAELDELDLEVSVLSNAIQQTVRSYDELINSLLPGVDGVVVRELGRSATFLPTVWEKIPRPADFVEALWKKAGSVPGSWTEHTMIETYSSVVIGPVRLTEI